MAGRKFHYFGDDSQFGDQAVGYDADLGQFYYAPAKPEFTRDKHGVMIPNNPNPRDLARYNKYWAQVEEGEKRRRATAIQASTTAQSVASTSIVQEPTASKPAPNQRNATSSGRKFLQWLNEPLPASLPEAQKPEGNQEGVPNAKPGFFRRITRELTEEWNPLERSKTSKTIKRHKGVKPYEGT
ncbi:uncharacterized protein BDZ99DRAFT_481904 [Mytilinidion resinicola]|uniref:Uncharacterized protein n=1 Tax=Mytilinidion resinicola TaxID=574789 RepID=A0A6A6Y3R1_9PEZI|nr:uncharacterized protein BDZ99DRAFT_481904 [Mytilinidion resinicola]KAF2803471.1 hypothetical protein BDZ99DRAFT_481904 [Mytilinidion resinicola]